MRLFPQKYRSFSALFFSSVIYSLSYVFVLFFIFCVIFFTHFRQYQSPEYISKLTDNPRSIHSHITYLKFLESANRLNEASKELVFIKLFQKKIHVDPKELAEIERLSKSIEKKRVVYSNTLSHYSYWNTVTREELNYRDGQYMLARYSFMLFNDRQSLDRLRSALYLDPLFEGGSIVLRELEKFY